jgi:hypothetical protein
MILSGGRSAPIRLALKEAPGRLGCCATIRVNTFPILIVAPEHGICRTDRCNNSPPSELFQSISRIPYLRHVNDLIALELHDIDVVSYRGLACGRNWAAIEVGAGKSPIGYDVPACFISGERLYLVTAVCQGDQKALHPLRVGAKRCNIGQRRVLACEASAGLQKVLHFSQPPPVSHETKKASANSIIVAMACSAG